MSRLCFIHTVPGLIDRFAQMAAETLTGVPVFHVLDESVLQDLLLRGPGPSIASRVARQAMLAEDAGASLIVFTCSSTSPAVDVARQLVTVPILKVDDPMAAVAVQAAQSIGVLCTTESTKGPSQALLAGHAAAAGRDVRITVRHVAGAFDALRSGQRELHDTLVSAAAAELAGQCEAIVLAQASLAHLQEPLQAELGLQVFASPQPLMAELHSRFGLAERAVESVSA